jgi:hypothetical protein
MLGMIPSLDNLYHNPAYARDDYRGIAADITAAWRDGDAIVLNAPNQWEVFTYYYPDQDVHPAPYRPTPDRVDAFLAPLVARQQRLFVLYWGEAESDPERLVERYLAGHTYHAGDQWYGDVRLAVYGVAPLPVNPSDQSTVRFGEAIYLRGYALPDTTFVPGDILPVTLFWEAGEAIAEPYKVTVQLLDASDQLVAQHDSEPAAGLAPTGTWQPAQVVIDRHGVAIPETLTAGRYALITGVYHALAGERLPVTLGGSGTPDHFTLARVVIAE